MTNRRYYRVILGRGHKYAELCQKENFIGVDFGLKQDVSNDLCNNLKDFNKKFIPVLQKARPNTTNQSAGIACAAIWTLGKGLKNGDIVLSPKSDGCCLVGEATGNYFIGEIFNGIRKPFLKM